MTYKLSLLVISLGDVPELEKAVKILVDFFKDYAIEFNYELVYDEPPEEFYNHERGQFNAQELLSWLERSYSGEADRILGVIPYDLYVPGLNFVFGVAELGGAVALVSSYRLWMPGESKSKYQLRLLKEMAHELGHTFGLEHCDTPRCVMRFSNSLYEVDEKDLWFCEKCSTMLADFLYHNFADRKEK